MIESLENREWLKCPSCATQVKKVIAGGNCTNCQCQVGKPCIKKVAEEVMKTHYETLKRLAD